MNEEKVPFLEMFPELSGLDSLCGGLRNAAVLSVLIDKAQSSMSLMVQFGRTAAPAELRTLEDGIAEAFGLEIVQIRPQEPKPKGKKRAVKKVPAGNVIYGRAIRKQPVPISGLSMESGTVVIQGEVFAVEHREIQKRKAVVMGFDITDHTSSIHVSKFLREGEEREFLDKIKKGAFLIVEGTVTYNRYDEDINLEPRNIMVGKKTVRQDTALEKRVELHLHTCYSTLDALTNPAAAVARAALWKHPAIAFTDHGTAQAFPDVWKAGKKHGVKVIYGLEGYYINDVDGKLAVCGDSDRPLTEEFVAFDLETTGLNNSTEAITEIGAVIFRNGEVIDRFETFVNPGKPIPAEVSRLTGIYDKDVADALAPADALAAFVAFVGDRPVVAHNADFDMGFVECGCQAAGITFHPVVLDTLVLSQMLLPDLRRHKLDIVASRLSLPDFRHHRAADDAITAAYIMDKFIAMLQEQGVQTIRDITPYLHTLHPSQKASRRTHHIILLVKNKVGLKNLYKLISLSHLEHFRKNPIIPKSLLMQYREGLIVGSACEAGEVFSAIVRHRSPSELRRLASFYDYLEIQPLCNNEFLVSEGKAADDEALREFNRTVIRLADSLGKPVVATGDVHFLDPEDEIYRHILMAARKFSDADRALPIYFKTTDEMLKEFSYLGAERAFEVVVRNPTQIAEQVEEFELLPKELFTPKIENSKEDLERLVYDRMHELYGDHPPEIVTTRIETELHDIITCRYDVIYMSAQKLVSNSLAAGYLVGSRGSVGSSLVAYMSGITEVNSLPAHYRCEKCKYSDFDSGKDYGCGADMPDKLCPVCGAPLKKEGFDIPFETFLGFGGDKVPDIDLNFSGEYQARAHKYTEELFGRDHVFRAGTIGTLADKTAYGYVKKYLAERNLVVTKAEENRLSKGCVGVKRTTGQHPGGLVIIPQDMDVTDFCPVQHPAEDKDSDIITTHFEYHCMEANLLKLDELGHDDPTMIRMLEDLTGVNAREIPLDDPETMQIFRSPAPLGLPDDDPIIGKTGSIGIPEFGTGFTRQMLVDTQPEGFDTLVRLSGFSHGTDVWLGNAKDLILSGTANINQTIGCRDDIMLYLISMGMNEQKAFKIMEGVRKGRSLTPEQEQEMMDLQVPQWYIDSCKKIKYLFPKAHAVAYVMMAFRIAWFKVHEPLAFYSAYFYRRSQKDSFDAAIMTCGIETVRNKIQEIKRSTKATAKEEDLLVTLEAVYEFYLRGFQFAPIDLYRSDESKFLIEGNGLRPPFVAISGLGGTAAHDLVSCRANGRKFVSTEEVLSACSKVSQAHMEQLKNLGALGDLPETSQISLFEL